MEYREALKNKKASKVLESVMYGDKSLDKKNIDSLFENLEEKADSDNKVVMDSSFASYDKIASVNEIDYGDVNFKYEYNKADSMIGRFSNRFQMYAVCNAALMSMHPTNPTYDYTLCSMKMEREPNETLYCVSKEYGVFYTNGKKSAIYHSSLDKKLSSYDNIRINEEEDEKGDLFYDLSDKGNPSVQTKYVIGISRDSIVEIENESKINQDMEKHRVFMTIVNDSKYIQLDKKDVCEIRKLSYDESYGISGRLLLYCINFGGL